MADGIIDGEVVALDHTGAPDFAALQAAISDAKTKDLVFFVFDQMFDGKEDLRPLPLTERKARLQANVEDAPANIRYVDHFITAGDAVLLLGLPHGPGRHRLQAARRALPVGPQRELGQVQMPAGPRGGHRRLDDDGRRLSGR